MKLISILNNLLSEGNAFGIALKKARDNDEDEFEVDGKTYKVQEALAKLKESLIKIKESTKKKKC